MNAATECIDELKRIERRLDEIAENYKDDYYVAIDQLESFKKRVYDLADYVYSLDCQLPVSGNSCPSDAVRESCGNRQCLSKANEIKQRIASLYAGIHGYDDRGPLDYDENEIMEMMYPNEDVYSEDFDDGYDPGDFAWCPIGHDEKIGTHNS